MIKKKYYEFKDVVRHGLSVSIVGYVGGAADIEPGRNNSFGGS